jgi:hypothetical protein
MDILSIEFWWGISSWQRVLKLFLAVFVGANMVLYLFVLFVDPYGVVPFSLPLDRGIVSLNQRYMYSQILRSRRYDSLIVGTSTSRLIDPEILNGPFRARFANVAINSASAREQSTIVDYFLAHTC